MDILPHSTNLGRKTPGETSLLGRAQAGDRDAFAELATASYPTLRHVARRVLRNDADVEDVVQEAMLKAFVHLAAYRGEAAFSTWLVRILLNQAFMFLRKQKTPPVALEDVNVESHQFCAFWGGESKTPEEICASQESEDMLRNCLHRLRPKYRMVLSLRAMDDKSYEEIAGELAIPVETVRVQLHRARREVREMVSRRRRGRVLQG